MPYIPIQITLNEHLKFVNVVLKRKIIALLVIFNIGILLIKLLFYRHIHNYYS